MGKFASRHSSTNSAKKCALPVLSLPVLRECGAFALIHLATCQPCQHGDEQCACTGKEHSQRHEAESLDRNADGSHSNHGQGNRGPFARRADRTWQVQRAAEHECAFPSAARHHPHICATPSAAHRMCIDASMVLSLLLPSVCILVHA